MSGFVRLWAKFKNEAKWIWADLSELDVLMVKNRNEEGRSGDSGSGFHLGGEFPGNALKDAGPVAQLGLSEETDGGVPGGVLAIELPSPVGPFLDQGPGGAGHRAGEVEDGGVDHNHQVQVGQKRRRVGEIPDVAGQIDDRHGGLRELLRFDAYLEREEPHIGHAGDRGEM